MHLLERSGNAHKPSGGAGCHNDPQPNMYLEFVNGNLRTDLRSFVGSGWSNYSLALTARKSNGSGETTTEWWKKFSPGKTKLAVEYNSPPTTPTAAHLSTHSDITGPANACVTGTGRPAIRSTTPWLKAVLNDPDGSGGGSLTGRFTLQKWNGSAWAAVAGWPKTKGAVAPGARAEMRVTEPMTGDDRFRWQVQTSDVFNSSSDWSPWCEFAIDGTPPGSTPTVAAADGIYLESPPNGGNQDPRGGLGQSARFTFGANGETDVHDYVYQVVGGPEVIAPASGPGGDATVWVTPRNLGENVLTVRSRDQAGNRSEPYDYVFRVGEATAPTATWMMNEESGNLLQTTPAGGPTATLSNSSASWPAGRVRGTHEYTGTDTAGSFNGTSDRAITPVPVLDTSRSFSLSAWVKLDLVNSLSQVVISQPGAAKSPFELQYVPSRQRWCFSTYLSDVANATMTANPACSAAPPRVGAWTHLTGVYDAGTGNQLSLYVNGALEGTGSSANMWSSTGGLVVGTGRNGNPNGFFDGLIDEVRVWDRVIDPGFDLAPLLEAPLVGQWEMEDWDEEEPRQESDGSPYNRPATLAASPAAEWCEGYGYSSGLCLRQADGLAQTDQPILHTDHSYTVSAWVNPTNFGSYPTVLSQCGAQRCGFYLQATQNPPRWTVTLPAADQLDPRPTYYALTAPGPAVLDTWVHLTAVYDASRSELKLYVDGQLAGSRNDLPRLWPANGPLRSVVRIPAIPSPARSTGYGCGRAF